MLVDETNVDVYYQVEPPIRDHDHCLLMHKVRELCSIFSSKNPKLVVFERSLQRPIAQIRRDMEVEGFKPEQLLHFIHAEEAITMRNGLAAISLRQCSLSGTPQPDTWAEAVRNQIGGFPAVVRPLRHHCAHSVGFIRNENEFKNWFRVKMSIMLYKNTLMMGMSSVQFARRQTEFSVNKSLKTLRESKILGCISAIETHRSVLECIQNQQPYALEYLSANQTRDIFPGLESFCIQVIKSVFPTAYLGLIFIRGYYKDHNEIFFLGFGLEPDSETARHLYALPQSNPWEVSALTAQLGPQPEDLSNVDNNFHLVINFPSAEGVLIHQTNILRRESNMRVSWKSAESAEMKDSDHLDDNVLQVFLWNSNRSQLLADCDDIIRSTDITIDRNALNERHSLCRKNVAKLTAKELVRSCTTTD
ncbi:hypothetical protein CAEBREN_09195 [Caenorhabditis brenneri]|uniref:ATP-grasp domain-containing protein n=1 Tax=Caenorhabditis brenneri TaxID=135651 RepID=G0MY02_CAEBE|nr:hypothetical protein CAEBREN_09195 [Caenorhabditis brenneri]